MSHISNCQLDNFSITINVVLGIDPNKAPQGTLPALLQAALDGHSLVIKAFIDHKVIR